MGRCARVRVCLLLAFFLPSPSQQQDDDNFGNDYLVDELPGQRDAAVFRPRSAREAMRHAARIAQKERSLETANYAILRQAGVPGAQRVAVYDVHDVTTSRYNFKRFRKNRSWDLPRPEDADRLLMPSEHDQQQIQQFQQQQIHQQHQEKLQQQRKRPQTSNADARPQQSWARGRPNPPRRKHRSSREKDNFKKLRDQKNSRYKRAVDYPEVASKFELPPMSNEWNVRKVKKKKKKKTDVTDPPTTKKMKASKRKRIFMESEELALGRREVKNVTGSRTRVIKGISKELEELLKGVNDEEEEYNPQLEAIQGTKHKTKFVPIPKNWQNPPSWKPPTRGSGLYGRQGQGQVRRRHMANIVTIGPQVISQESTEATEQGTNIETSTTSYDWREFKKPMSPSQMQFEAEKGGLVLKPAPTDWPEPTHPPDGVYDWHKAQYRRFPRTRRPYIAHAPLSHSEHSHQYNRIQWTQWPTMAYTRWSRFRATDEALAFRRNDMWQLGTKSPHQFRYGLKQDIHQLSEAHQLKAYGTLKKSVDHPPLTAGPPLDTINKHAMNGDHQDAQRVDYTEGGLGYDEEKHHQYQNNYGQGNWQGRQRGPDGREMHQQVHQTYYANYTNYYNYYYQNYYSQLENKTRAYHYEHSNHYQDRKQSSGHYQGHSRSQFHSKPQSRLRPPDYFYTPLNDYAGNSQDLRAPLPTQPGDFFQQTTAWSYPRYRPHQGLSRRRYRGRRPAGQPSGYHGMFNAPLQRSQWQTTPRTL